MAGFYIGIDQGTTLTTAVLVDEALKVVSKASVPHNNYYPEPGWMEQDPVEIYENCLKAVRAAIEKAPGVSVADVLAFGLDHQGETCCIWDKNTGKPIYRAIVWQDRRTAATADRLIAEKGAEIKRITGLMPDAYYSATKFAWMLDHVEGARDKAECGELLFGTLNTYIFWRLSGGKVYKTDPTSGAATMLMNLEKTCWEASLVEEILGISVAKLPEICDCCDVLGYTDPNEFFGVSVPIACSTADSSAAIIGGGCFGAGNLKTSYGTGNFMSLQIGSHPIIDDSGIMTDCIYRENGTAWYRFRGACYVAGGAMEWLKNGIGIVSDPKDTSDIAYSVPDSNGVYFVPAFSGLATPHWDPYARGAFLGLTGAVERPHLIRAVLESIAYQVTDCYRALRKAYDKDSAVMRADGGMVENDFLMQLQADMLGFPVEVPEEKESAAYGSACIAAHATGGLDVLTDLRNIVKIKKVFEPQMSADEREYRFEWWTKAVGRCLSWIEKGDQDEA